MLEFVLMVTGYMLVKVFEVYRLGGGLMLAACALLTLLVLARRRELRRTPGA